MEKKISINFFRMYIEFIRVVLPYWLTLLALVVLLPLMATKDVSGIPTDLILWLILCMALTVTFLYNVPDHEQHVARLIFFPKSQRRKYLCPGWHFINRAWWYVPKDVHGKKEKPDRGRFRQHLGEKKLKVSGKTKAGETEISYTLVIYYRVLKGWDYAFKHNRLERHEIEDEMSIVAKNHIGTFCHTVSYDYARYQKNEIFDDLHNIFEEIVDDCGNAVTKVKFENFC